MPFMRDRLKQRRIDMGITLQDVADTIEVEKPTVQRYESGKITKITTLTVERLAHAVRCNPAYLMGWTDNPSITPNTVELQNDEFELVEKYRNLMLEGKRKLAEYADDLISSGKYDREQEKYIEDRTNYIKNNSLPFAAAGGDTSNLDEAQELYDKAKARRKQSDE